MTAELTIESSLEHDGDELISFAISASSQNFSAHTLAWEHADDLGKLADVLGGFPSQSDASISFTFGTAGTGACALRFMSLDALGHLGLWATFEATYPAARTGEHEAARIFLRFDPASIDTFAKSLRAFAPGATNRAVLYGTSS